MSEKRKKRNSEVINELSTAEKVLFMTPDKTLSKKRGHEFEEEQDFDTIPISFASANNQQQGDRFIPIRSSPISRQLFNMPDNLLISPLDVSNKNEREQNSLIFENLLEQKLLKLKYDQVSEASKDVCEGSNFPVVSTKTMSAKSAKSQLTPIKKMNEQHFIVKRPRLLNFSDKKPDSQAKEEMDLEPIIDSSLIKRIREMRKISKTPYKVLDAPELEDDFYQNILDWSAQDVIAIALSKVLYFWSNRQVDNNVMRVSELMDNAFYCSVKWNPSGTKIGTGSDLGMLEIIDSTKPVCLWSLDCHANRVSSMSWKSEDIISTGSRDNTIKTMDLRTKKVISVLQRHTQEVCGLKWSPNGVHLASGGNDNIINIWDQRKFEQPILSFDDHKAAVRALAWSPHQYGVLLSGGGNIDKSLKFWNISQGCLTSSVETESQICNLAFSSHCNEFVTTHGFSGNQIMVWNASNNERITVLEGHISRVLHLAVSPDGENIATAAADETLKFWKVFPRQNMFDESEKSPSLLQLR